VGDVGDLVPLEPTELRLEVQNDGEVTAKYVVVAFFLEGVYFDPAPKVPAGSLWKFFPRSDGWQVQWDGGLTIPVFPGVTPRTPRIELRACGSFRRTTLTEVG
jgi:hypothetical protein